MAERTLLLSASVRDVLTLLIVTERSGLRFRNRSLGAIINRGRFCAILLLALLPFVLYQTISTGRGAASGGTNEARVASGPLLRMFRDAQGLPGEEVVPHTVDVSRMN
ncbi:MAG: hypothetical protein SFU56_22645 [Capsulimonadales bacterium]|nr:hypothetical protein [Capsulimonadales bacterium]